jgi:hypothetical protein
LLSVRWAVQARKPVMPRKIGLHVQESHNAPFWKAVSGLYSTHSMTSSAWARRGTAGGWDRLPPFAREIKAVMCEAAHTSLEIGELLLLGWSRLMGARNAWIGPLGGFGFRRRCGRRYWRGRGRHDRRGRRRCPIFRFGLDPRLLAGVARDRR